MRDLARALDALVRSSRTHGHAIEPAAERLRACWAALSDATVQINPQGLAVGEVPASELGETELRWLLPAFMAGLRTVTPRPAITVDELRAFADELARLDSDATSIARFRDWLWANGSEGFVLDVQTSFIEVFEDNLVDAETQGSLVAMHDLQRYAAANRSVLLSAQDLDEAAQRDEFDVPLSMATPQAGDPRFAMRPTAAAALRAMCDDEARWRFQETAMFLAHRSLYESLNPEAFARRVISVLTRDPTGTGVELVELLTSVARRGEPFARALITALDGDGFAEALSAVLLRSTANLRLLAEVVIVAGPETTERLVALLLERAEESPTWLAALSNLAAATNGRLDALLSQGDPNCHTTVRLRALGPTGVRWMVSTLRGDQRWTPQSLTALCEAAIAEGLSEELLVPFVRDRHAPVASRLRVLDALDHQPAVLARCVSWRPGEFVDAPEVKEKFRLIRHRLQRTSG